MATSRRGGDGEEEEEEEEESEEGRGRGGRSLRSRTAKRKVAISEEPKSKRRAPSRKTAAEKKKGLFYL